MRLCCICRQTCVFTAVACECDKNRVSCVRHYNFMCRCAKDKKFMLGKYEVCYLKVLPNSLYDGIYSMGSHKFIKVYKK